MPSQQDIKQRITSVTGTSKITRAMELVASAKLRRAQVRIEALRPYAKGMRRLMAGATRRAGNLNGIPL
ncbi:MAG: ATP synthase F1 subunit gamma, partial [Actinobacteria bacterium]|nr:ATP synthase F1 subunit gamma [Actinomycetota bacterium]